MCTVCSFVVYNAIFSLFTGGTSRGKLLDSNLATCVARKQDGVSKESLQKNEDSDHCGKRTDSRRGAIS